MRLLRIAPLMLLATIGHLACGPGRDEGAGQVRHQRKASNELVQNGLTSNGLFQNSLASNGLFQNGLFQNGLFQNGLFQNGLIPNLLWQDALWQQNPAARAALRESASTRQVLKYIYECAMSPGDSTALDPEGANLKLNGLIGLAPEWGRAGGACDESCQRWVTACLLARTNAYGVKVDLSLRAPDDAPSDVKKALVVTDEERANYTLREGAFYGNLFRQEARGEGPSVMAPRFYACAGPGSNTPEVTKRFNSSPGAGGPIEVVGPCLTDGTNPPEACDGLSGDASTGAVRDCYPSMNPDRQGLTRYREVITVYLKEPIATCGNGVCEAGEEGGAGACPSDCPAGWAKSFAAVLTQGSVSAAPDHRRTLGSWARTSAVAPDDTIVLAGVAPGAVTFGDVPLAPGGAAAAGVIATFAPGGALRWDRRFDVDGRASLVAVAVRPAPPGDYTISALLNERQGQYGSALRVVTFDQNGALLWSRPYGESATTSSVSANALAIAPNGDLFVAATLNGSMAFGSATLEAGPGSPREFVLKLSPAGDPIWASRLDDQGQASLGARAIKVSPTSPAEVVVSLRHAGGGGLWKLSPDGATQWRRPGIFGGVAFGPAGGVYATGALEGDLSASPYGFPTPPSVASVGDLFVVKYDQAGGQAADFEIVRSLCSDPRNPCAYRWFTGREIAFTAAGELLVGVRGGRRSTVELGSGPFRAYETDDLFVAAFSPGLEPIWSKHLSMVLDGNLGGVHFGRGAGGQPSVVVSGTFAGSMLVNGRMRVTESPQLRGVGSTFLASFALPPPADTTAPVIVGELPTGTKTETVEATSAAGAKVFYAPPLSTDAEGAGVSVSCSPPPNSFFPRGPNPVECLATDAHGNQTPYSFVVQVVDKGPVFVAPPPPVVVAAAGDGMTPVSFSAPRAVDLIEGDRPVTCTPESGSWFPLGTHQVTCRAQDSRETVTEVSFPVHVRYGGLSCGNGLLDPGEQCDDGGNDDDGDGCTSACVKVNARPDCQGAGASPANLLASTGQMWAPIAIAGVTDPDGDPLTIRATKIRQDEPVSLLWCPGGTCADAQLEPLLVRAERDTWAETDPQPDGRVYHVDFEAEDSRGLKCWGAVQVCVQRRHDVMSCVDQGPLYNSLDPWAP